MSRQFAQAAYDVVVVGGGVAGGALAASLASLPRTRPYKVALLEARPPPPPPSEARPPFPGLRCVALSPRSSAFLQDIGVWNEQLEARATDYTSMYIWDWFSRGKLQFNEEEVGSPNGALGHIVEVDVLQRAIFDKLSELHSDGECGLELISPAVVKNVTLAKDHSSWPLVALQDGRELMARVLVGADGAKSMVKSAADIGTTGRSYGQRGVVASLRVKGMQRTAWQRFLPTGPIALLPFGQDYASLVWSLPTATAERLEALSASEFIAAVQDALTAPSSTLAPPSLFQQVLPQSLDALLPTLLGPARVPPVIEALEGIIAGFPLSAELADSMVSRRTALLGDAAHVVHPMAGQGLNLGLFDASVLFDVVAEASSTGQDLGNALCLAEYEKRSRRHAQMVVGGVELLKQVFEMDFGPAAFLRNVGMDAIDSVPVLKARLARVAMGMQ